MRTSLYFILILKPKNSKMELICVPCSRKFGTFVDFA